MAEQRRGYVWLRCSVCLRRNYRTARLMKVAGNQAQKTGPPANMTIGNRLQIRKFCHWCRQHTEHNEDRKK